MNLLCLIGLGRCTTCGQVYRLRKYTRTIASAFPGLCIRCEDQDRADSINRSQELWESIGLKHVPPYTVEDVAARQREIMARWS